MALSLLELPWECAVGTAFDLLARRERRQSKRAQKTTRLSCSETDEGYEYRLMLPGVPKNSMEVDLHRSRVTVTATKVGSDGHCEKISERFRVPDDVDQERLNAEAKNGILHISAPKVPHKPAASIEVNTDMQRDAECFEEVFELPGVSANEINVEVKDVTVHIHVERDEKRMHFRSGFERAFEFPDLANLEGTKAFCRDGILVVQAPKQSSRTLMIADGQAPEMESPQAEQRMESPQEAPGTESLQEGLGTKAPQEEPGTESPQVKRTTPPQVEPKMYRMHFEMPGVPSHQIRVEHTHRHLQVIAKTSMGSKDISERTCHRNVLLPLDVDLASLGASYNNGILTISAAKKVYENRSISVN